MACDRNVRALEVCVGLISLQVQSMIRGKKDYGIEPLRLDRDDRSGRSGIFVDARGTTVDGKWEMGSILSASSTFKPGPTDRDV